MKQSEMKYNKDRHELTLDKVVGDANKKRRGNPTLGICLLLLGLSIIVTFSVPLRDYTFSERADLAWILWLVLVSFFGVITAVIKAFYLLVIDRSDD